ncbi:MULTISPECIES: DUF5946 family protein [unclassified Sphingomonas]|nr:MULTISPECIES: DUF5946 family protein [unclassified Sphingomonas]
MRDEADERCPGCGGFFPATAGPTHSYMLSTPGCWAAYGRLLTREYENPALFGAVHRLTVDAHALQHPGDPSDRRAVQSVWVHYAALRLAFARRRPLAGITPIMQKLAKGHFASLPDIPIGFAITHADVLAAPVASHVPMVREWARCAYDAWAALGEPTDILLDRLGA